ncbi:hypothetical protein ACRS3X_17580 [Ectopseudomonas hydrolytica]|uniref:hypothetical protein n=1 Tax=Ectopseudomonas hydrolytica TaxID=2493633 RepID=UPI003EE023BD
MEEFKLAVEILSSIASLIAILTVLYSWHANRKHPISISEIISTRSGSDTFRLFVKIKNTKPYPVTVKSLVCYKKETHRVEKRINERPKTMTVLDSRDRLFTIQNEILIPELGENRIEVNVTTNAPPTKSLIFMLDTTHGHLSTICKKVKFFSTAPEIFSPDFMISRESKISSMTAYIRAYTVYLIDLLPFKLNRLRGIVSPRN